MAKRGRKQKAGLRWHSARGMYYKLYNGKMRYFPPAGRKGKEPDPAVRVRAEFAWHNFEAERMHSEIALSYVAPPTEAAFKLFDMRKRIGAAELQIKHAKNEEEIEQIKQRLRQGLEELEPQTPIAPVEGKTCKDVVDAYLKYLSKNAGRSHCLDAKSRLPNWLKYIGADTPIRALNRESFIRYRDRMNETVKSGRLSQSSVNKMYVLVKGAFTRARLEKGITAPELSEFVKLLRTKQPDQTDKSVFTPDDMSKLLDSFDVKFQAITLIALNAALSNKDVALDLTWGCIQWDEKYLKFDRVKQKGIRRTPLWNRTIAKLKGWRELATKTGDDDLTFPNQNGVPFIVFTDNSKNDNLSVVFRKRFKKLGLTGYSFGTFRRSGATAAKLGTDADGVRMLLGDASNEVWKRHYVMACPELVKDGVEAIERFYFPEK